MSPWLSKQSFACRLVDLGVRPGDALLVAFSGGIDSVTLLYLCAALRDDYDFKVFAGHVNHHLREEADRDRWFVEEVCRDWGVKLSVQDVFPASRLKGESIEMWGRRVRYAALEQMRKNHHCHWILTAHHGNDVVETLLFHLNQSCGVDGLRGIANQVGKVLRPLLTFKRSDIDRWAENHRLPYVEDTSNQDCRIPRNRIRHQVVQPWQEQVPDLVDRFLAISRKAKQAIENMNRGIELLAHTTVIAKNGSYYLSVEKLESLAGEVSFRLIKYLVGDKKKPWRRHRREALLEFLSQAPVGTMMSVGKHWNLLRDRNEWILAPVSVKPRAKTVKVNKPVLIEGNQLLVRWADTAEIPYGDPNTEMVDRRVLFGKDLKVRPWQAGDRFRPLGMEHEKKVSDFLTDIKMDRLSKNRQLVLTADDEIIWLCGQRISDRAKVTERTAWFAELSFQPAVGT